MSIGLPFIFTVKKYERDVYVDGGVINSFPMHLVEDQLDRVLGIRLASAISPVGEINSMDSYVVGIVTCFLMQRSKGVAERYSEHTVNIYTDSVMKSNLLDFALTQDDRYRLVQIGYEAVNSYFCPK
jgi:NTE family protein